MAFFLNVFLSCGSIRMEILCLFLDSTVCLEALDFKKNKESQQNFQISKFQ